VSSLGRYGTGLKESVCVNRIILACIQTIYTRLVPYPPNEGTSSTVAAELTGQNLGRVFNSKVGCLPDMHLHLLCFKTG
jgi:hypothetical protein